MLLYPQIFSFIQGIFQKVFVLTNIVKVCCLHFEIDFDRLFSNFCLSGKVIIVISATRKCLQFCICFYRITILSSFSIIFGAYFFFCFHVPIYVYKDFAIRVLTLLNVAFFQDSSFILTYIFLRRLLFYSGFAYYVDLQAIGV